MTEAKTRRIIFSITVVLLTAGFSGAARADALPAGGPKIELSAKMFKDSRTEYIQKAKEMFAALEGNQPRPFTIDGVEYRGRSVGEGKNQYVYIVEKDGETFAMKIPKDPAGRTKGLTYPKIQETYERAGIHFPKLIQRADADHIATLTERLDGFESFSNLVEEHARNPHDPRTLKKMAALEKFLKSHGHIKVTGMDTDQFGIYRREDGAFEGTAADGTFAFDEPTPAESYSETPTAEGMNELRLRLKKDPTLTPTNLEALDATEARFSEIISHSISAPAVGAECPRPRLETTATKIAIKAMGLANDAFNISGLILSVLLPETNPFAGEPVGVPCAKANALKGQMKCEWQTPLDPTDDRVNCSVIKAVRPTGKKAYMLRTLSEESVCGVTYDTIGFRAGNGERKARLKTMGLFGKTGIPIAPHTAKSFLENLKKQLKFTDSFLQEDEMLPPGKPSAGIES